MIKKSLAISFAICAFSSALSAQENEPDWSLDGYVGLSSDYRDRGISMSNKDASFMGSLALFHKSGFYGGLDVATIDDGRGGDKKTEFFAGYTIDKGDYIYDFSVEFDGIQGDTSNYYTEYKASIARDFGLAFIRSGVAFAPEGRWNTPGVDSFYTYGDLEVPVPTIPELTFLTHVGYDARSGRSNLWDWSVGFSAFVETFEVSLTYEDSSWDKPIGKGRLILGTKFYF